ncbi:MAG: tRNA pseudouridine(38-40) synthase TruA [Mariprofundaceae bacterium]
MNVSQKQRIALAIEFDGHGLSGWQRQKNASTVQEKLEIALQKVEGEHIGTTSSGRTDAGVHAEAMLIHADISLNRWQLAPRAYLHGINQNLPNQIRILGVRAVANDFHARFDCRAREYRYQIWNRPVASALLRWRHWWMPRPLSIDAMQQATTYLLGEQDFSSFQAAGCQASSSIRNLMHCHVHQDGDVVCITVKANGFLYHMVRNIVGALVQVGIGRWHPDKMRELVKYRSRKACPATAPAHGLYFANADYDEFQAMELSQAGKG